MAPFLFTPYIHNDTKTTLSTFSRHLLLRRCSQQSDHRHSNSKSICHSIYGNLKRCRSRSRAQKFFGIICPSELACRWVIWCKGLRTNRRDFWKPISSSSIRFTLSYWISHENFVDGSLTKSTLFWAAFYVKNWCWSGLSKANTERLSWHSNFCCRFEEFFGPLPWKRTRRRSN